MKLLRFNVAEFKIRACMYCVCVGGNSPGGVYGGVKLALVKHSHVHSLQRKGTEIYAKI